MLAYRSLFCGVEVYKRHKTKKVTAQRLAHAANPTKKSNISPAAPYVDMHAVRPASLRNLCPSVLVRRRKEGEGGVKGFWEAI